VFVAFIRHLVCLAPVLMLLSKPLDHSTTTGRDLAALLRLQLLQF
jgi:hypothetical protein